MYGLLWLDNIWPGYNYLNIWNLTVRKAFQVVQMKFLAMQIIEKKLSCFDIFIVGYLQNIFMELNLYLIS